MPLENEKVFVIIISENNSNSNKLSQVKNVLFSYTLNLTFALGISYFVYYYKTQKSIFFKIDMKRSNYNIEYRTQ